MGAKDGGRKGGPRCRVMLPCVVAAGVQFSLALQLSLLTHAVRPLHAAVFFFEVTSSTLQVLRRATCSSPSGHHEPATSYMLQFWVDVELNGAEGPVQSGVA